MKTWQILLIHIVLTYFVILPIFKNLWSKKLKDRCTDFLKEFKIKKNEHTEQIFNSVEKKYEDDLSKSAALCAFGPIIALIIAFFSERDSSQPSSLFIALVFSGIFLVLFILKGMDVPKVNKKSITDFSCPKCQKDFCWFLEKTYKTDEKQIVKHERKEEKDSKGKIHIVYAPVDYLKYKKHMLYQCEKCHY